MTTISPNERAQRYVTSAFKLNPLYDARRLVDLRALWLRIERVDGESDSASAEDLSRIRKIAQSQIDNVQQTFWQAPIETLKRSLEAISVRQVPEFAPTVARLKLAAACRGEFPRLSQDPLIDRDLFAAFKSAIVLPPAAAGAVRERFIQKIKSRSQLKKVKRSVAHLRTNYSLLYGMERDWFAALANHRLKSKAISESGSVGFSLPNLSWPVWIVIFFVIRLVIHVLTNSH